MPGTRFRMTGKKSGKLKGEFICEAVTNLSVRPHLRRNGPVFDHATECAFANYYTMARFYFHVFNDEVTIDEEGAELPDADAAQARAIIEARNLAAHSIISYGHLTLDHRIEVADEVGSPVAKVEFGDAVEIKRSN